MFIEKLNKSQNGPYVIEEEKVVVGGKWEGFLDHDNVNHKTISIHTGSKFTGEKVENFFISAPSETPWKTHLKIFSTSPSVFVVYESSGDQVEAEDINKLQDTLVNEIDRSIVKDNELNTKVDSEISRATTKENSIEAKLNSEITRSTNKDNTLDAKIDTEISRATSVEDGLLLNLNNYKTSNDAEVGQLKNRTNLLEINKSDKTYVDTELNKRYLKTQTYTKEEVLQKIQDIIGTAPAALDTLQEIATALNNDANFAGTMTNELSKKVDKIVGKQLSTEDYTPAEKTKLAGMESGANKYIHPSTHSLDIVTETATKKIMTDVERSKLDGISNNAKKVENSLANGNIKIDGVETNVYTHPSGTNPHGATKSDVGLGNLDNIRQASKVEFDAHNHDSAYRKRDIVTGISTEGWNRIAQTPSSSSVHSAIFQVKGRLSNYHTALIFSVSIVYGVSPTINVLQHSNYAHALIDKIRIVSKSTYDQVFIELSCAAGGTLEIEQITELSSISLIEPIVGSVPTGYVSTELTLTNKGFQSSQDIYINDKKIYHSGDFNISDFATKSEIGQAGYGDMLKSIYDKNNNGKVDNAELADKVPWSGITEKPSTFIPSPHTHTKVDILDTRDIDSPPSFYQTRDIHFEFKRLTTISITGTSGTYCTVMSDGRWTGSSGGQVTQIAFTDSGKIYCRTSTSTTTWGAWKELFTKGTALTWNDLKGV